MRRKVEYCSLDPIFPKSAFMLFFFILHQDQILGIVPLDAVYASSEEALVGVSQTVKQFSILDQEITIPQECLLIPIRWNSLYPLKKEFWTKPTLSYTTQIRMKTFAKVYEHPKFYSLLVTPYSFDGNTWQLHVALPFEHTATGAVERFMFTSDHIVEPRAKYAALYTIGEKMRFNWQTGEIKQFDNLAKKLLHTFN